MGAEPRQFFDANARLLDFFAEDAKSPDNKKRRGDAKQHVHHFILGEVSAVHIDIFGL